MEADNVSVQVCTLACADSEGRVTIRSKELRIDCESIGWIRNQKSLKWFSILYVIHFIYFPVIAGQTYALCMHTNFLYGDKFVWGSKRASRWDQWWLKGTRKIGLTVMDSRQQNHEDEGDDWRETICNHDHDHRTMCFSQSRCSQSLRTCFLHPRCMESSHTAGPITVAVNFYINFFLQIVSPPGELEKVFKR